MHQTLETILLSVCIFVLNVDVLCLQRASAPCPSYHIEFIRFSSTQCRFTKHTVELFHQSDSCTAQCCDQHSNWELQFHQTCLQVLLFNFMKAAGNLNPQQPSNRVI